MTLQRYDFDKDAYARFRLKKLEQGLGWLWIALIAQGLIITLLSATVFAS